MSMGMGMGIAGMDRKNRAGRRWIRRLRGMSITCVDYIFLFFTTTLLHFLRSFPCIPFPRLRARLVSCICRGYPVCPPARPLAPRRRERVPRGASWSSRSNLRRMSIHIPYHASHIPYPYTFFSVSFGRRRSSLQSNQLQPEPCNRVLFLSLFFFFALSRPSSMRIPSLRPPVLASHGIPAQGCFQPVPCLLMEIGPLATSSQTPCAIIR